MDLVYLVIALLTLIGVGLWGYLWWKEKKAINQTMGLIFYKILIPKKESDRDERSDAQNKDFKETVSLMEQFYASMYNLKGHIVSFEYAVIKREVFFYIVLPEKYEQIVEKQITSFYPDAIIEKEQDYNIFTENSYQAGCYLSLDKSFAYPFKTYQKLESDPLNNITNSLSKLGEGEGAAIQLIITPVKNKWQKKCKKVAEDLYAGKSSGGFNPFEWVGDFLAMLVKGNEEKTEEQKRITPMTEETVKSIEGKSNSVGFEAVMRVVASAPTKVQAQMIVDNIRGSFVQFDAPPELNEWKESKYHSVKKLVERFIFRSMDVPFWGVNKMILSKEELASIFHFPNSKYNLAPNIKWQNFKIAPAPENVPTEGVLLGHNTFRGETREVKIANEDRFRHFYVIGQTGTGKSSMLKLMIRQDLYAGKGLCVIDPHGELVHDILPMIPRERADDVIVFDPSDQERPMGINILEAETEEERDLIALDAMNIMIKLFGNEIFGPRIQDYFRNGCLTLMADPLGGCLTDIVRLFTDDEFQQQKVQHVTNPVVKSFWTKQMAQTGQREKQEMIPYFAAKFGQFVTNSMMRNIIGQARSSFDFGQVMQDKKILLMNLSKGEVGDINSELLGMIIVSKMQMAAMRRQRIAKELRSDFFLYIDEFQNYVTDSIESILSEARKYRLGLILAHQYLDQLEKKGHGGGVNLKGAIFGNVGTIMSYKIGATDAEYMAKEFSPVFGDQDMINIDQFKAVIKLSIKGQPSRPFSLNVVKPWDLPPGDPELAAAYVQLSRLTYGRDREFVEKEIFHRIGLET